MKPYDPATPESRDDAFDAAMRARHRLATEQLSPHVRARLDAARAAVSTPAVATGHRPTIASAATARQPSPPRAERPVAAWAFAGAFAVVAVVAIALQLRHAPADTPVNPAAVARVIPDDANAADADADPTVALDESPDLYLWLAASDDVPPRSPEY